MKLSATVLLLSLVAVFSWANMSAADEYAGTQWAAKDQVSIDQINHQPFHELLQKFVDADGQVNYAAWQADTESRTKLTTYLTNLSRANPNANAGREAKLAYWINAYNALTVEGILRVYPTTSIRNHTPKVLGYNIWKKLWLYSGSGKINLDQIEHQVLRKMSEPRIHFAIVCASIGCPRLMNEAYTADKIEQQLVTNTTDFFSRQQNLQLDVQNKKLKLSAIMDWFGSDFGATTAEQIRKVMPYFPENVKTAVAQGGYTVGHLDYDWNLNAQK